MAIGRIELREGSAVIGARLMHAVSVVQPDLELGATDDLVVLAALGALVVHLRDDDRRLARLRKNGAGRGRTLRGPDAH